MHERITNRWINHPIIIFFFVYSILPSIHQSIILNQSINQSIIQLESISHAVSQSIDRSIDWSSLQSVYWSTFSTWLLIFRAGAHHRTQTDNHVQDIKVIQVVTHPEYHKPKQYSHDFALLKLEKPATLNRWVFHNELLIFTIFAYNFHVNLTPY